MEQIVCPACSKLGLTRISESIVYEGCPICYDLLALPKNDDPEAPCQCISCKTVRVVSQTFSTVNPQIPHFGLKVGLSLPPWLRQEIHYDTVLAIREILRQAIVTYLETKSLEPGSCCCSKIDKRYARYDRQAEERYLLELTCFTQHCQRRKKRRGANQRNKSQPIDIIQRLNYDLEMSWQSCSIIYSGRYVKLCRDLAQTQWINKDYYSIEEYLRAFFQDHHKPSGNMTLIGSGREDVDVCMLGLGRPFLFEIHNPLQFEDMPTISNPKLFHDGKVIIHDLKRLDLKCYAEVAQTTKKFNESQKRKLKVYGLVIVCGSEIHNLDELNEKYTRLNPGDGDAVLQIAQRTPSRVVHRRANIKRMRNVYSLRVHPITWNKPQPNESAGRAYVCELVASAGFYIKEFIHGDFGRTVPSFGDLAGVDSADLVQLDVLNVLSEPSNVLSNPLADEEDD